MDATRWKRCNACKQPIAFGQPYWVCSVSTCNRKRTALSFCTVSCWEVHLPIANHREAWAEERRAPTRAEAQAAREAEERRERERAERQRGSAERGSAGRKREATERQRAARPPSVPSQADTSAPAQSHGPAVIRRPGRSRGDDEILIVASRLKDYIRQRSGLQTSDRVLAVLSDVVRRECDAAIGNARRAERRTVLDRDLPRR